ncbi:MAG: arginine--tRNA ligase [Solirubrobacterales bacterium]
MGDPLLDLRDAVDAAAASLRDGEGGDATPSLERPPKADLGDYSTNAAMLLAPSRGEPPREVADRLREELDDRLGSATEKIEVAGPGFLNLFLTDRWYREGVAAVLAAGGEFGGGVVDASERVQVEFVSANPTGPLTAAGGRHAAYGDSVARILGFAGHSVEREYYVNDKGGQVRRFAESIAARMSGADPPEDGYEGAYVEELARELAGDGAPGDLDALERLGAERMREAARATLERFGVRFDAWFSERSLYEDGKVDAALADLRGRGHIYESEGAVWLRTTEFGDDKDRVLIRSDGEPTYFASDVAYHRDKLERGFDRLLNVLGADHHGYVARIKAALGALGADPERFEALIMQLVHVVEGGERAQMSKRRGEFVTLDELIDDIGTDAARFLMLQRSHETTVDLDLELARRQSQDNPVYYVQYAHARIASILRKAGEEATGGALASVESSFAAVVEPSERALIKRVLELPGDVNAAAQARAPHRLCAYATATAADFHAFYRDCKVLGAESEGGSAPGTEAGRLAICVATKRVISRTLELLGVSAPERM